MNRKLRAFLGLMSAVLLIWYVSWSASQPTPIRTFEGTGRSHAMRFSPDDRMLLTVSRTELVIRELEEENSPSRRTGEFGPIAEWSSDGSRFTFVDWTPDVFESGRVELSKIGIQDARNKEPLISRVLNIQCTSLAFLSDRLFLASGVTHPESRIPNSVYICQLLDPPERGVELIGAFARSQAANAWCVSTTARSTTQLIIVTFDSDEIPWQVWTVTMGEEAADVNATFVLDFPERGYGNVSISPLGNTIACMSVESGFSVYRWEDRRPKLLVRSVASTPMSVGAFNQVACSPNGKLVAGSLSDRLEVRETVLGKLTWQLDLKGRALFSICFTSDSQCVAAAFSDRICVYRVVD